MPDKPEKKPLEEQLYSSVSHLIELARLKVIASVNTTMVTTYFEIGRLIVEHEQQGEERAAYGKGTLKQLSIKLSDKFGKGFSVENLDRMRFFYKVYANQNSSTLLTNLSDKAPEANSATLSRNFQLSWSHYIKLMRIENPDERRFYEIESIENNWSLRELQRQFDSALYERLALSRDKAQVKQLAEKGQQVQQPQDIIKDPYVLEFLGLKEEAAFSESKLENRIIDELQHFLLELGKGFAFVGRQVRFTFDEKHFRIDLVFYNRFLRCFVLLDLKIGEVSHQDLGQMQMYVNYYDRFVKTDDENPTIGIILCKEKNKALVEITLPKENNQIFASKYQTFLPSKEELKAVLNDTVKDDENIGGEA
ncbi:PDDEXK nuclease domain-containing protein [Botryobacter ruber]|uniref:PDDEXK nuclease domain-containing protein n=1 Tax=Botryobacter ruber TaxID=2171629 RepID=UPI000E0A8161|nr:PDDEXK nuclease domain-containing protein [Botryobacter ruber]